MENAQFKLDQIRERLGSLADRPGWSLNRVAREAGVTQSSLWRFTKEGKDLSGRNLERIWPLVVDQEHTTEQEEPTSEAGA